MPVCPAPGWSTKARRIGAVIKLENEGKTKLFPEISSPDGARFGPFVT
jgi:hypothetical protein